MSFIGMMACGSSAIADSISPSAAVGDSRMAVAYAAFVFAVCLFSLAFGIVVRQSTIVYNGLVVFALQLLTGLTAAASDKTFFFLAQPFVIASFFFFARSLKRRNENQNLEVLQANWLILLATLPLTWVLMFALAFGLVAESIALSVAAIQSLVFSVAFFAREQRISRKTLELHHKSELMNGRNAIIRQVSHDIRSPLSALSMVVGTLNELPESRRLLIRNATQRINDITNDLTKREKSSPLKGLHDLSDLETEPEMIVSLIDSIVSEKRLQYRERMDVEIQGDLEGGYGLFVQISPGDFSRAISNLIDNSIQAVGESGTITISVSGERDQVKISVRDNGCGISPEILEKLGQSQEGDPGIKRTNSVFAKAGGSMTFSSTETQGALVEILLPRAKTPHWFVKALALREGTQVISVDDDQTIHQIWKGRFASADPTGRGVLHSTFSSVDQFESWVAAHRKSAFVYLIDYEFLGQDRNGLELIEKLGLESQAILVTSRYEEPQIRQRAERLGIRILPKSLAPLIPIEIGQPLEKLDAVLIDDDSLVHMSWQMAARSSGKSLRVFSSREEFSAAASGIDLATPLYIDVNLGHGIKGQDVAVQASRLGFSTIFLATGYDAEDVLKPACVSHIVGKDPIF